MSKSQEIFQRDLASDAFQAGCVAGRWGLFEDTIRPAGAPAIAWPNIVIWLSAPPRPKSPERYYLNFDLEGYPTQAPTAHCWNPATRAVLLDDLWPHSRDGEELAFRKNWPGPPARRALYAPWDRSARAGGGHAEWLPLVGLIWNPEKHTIVDYLKHTHALLNADHYTGTYEAQNP